jgi:putative cell wall-binding protein
MKRMKQLILSLLFIFIALFADAAPGEKKHAVVIYAGEMHEYSKSYRAKLKKGDLNYLRSHLRQASTQVSSGSVRSEEQMLNDHVKRITNNKKEHHRKAPQLSEKYRINEKKLKKGNKIQQRKYLKQKQKLAKTEKKREKEEKIKKEKKTRQIHQESLRKNSYLSKNFRFSNNRLRKGEKMKFPEGQITLIIQYKIYEDGVVKSYVDVLDDYVKAGSNYLLKYSGSDARREYYLEYQGE